MSLDPSLHGITKSTALCGYHQNLAPSGGVEGQHCQKKGDPANRLPLEINLLKCKLNESNAKDKKVEAATAAHLNTAAALQKPSDTRVFSISNAVLNPEKTAQIVKKTLKDQLSEVSTIEALELILSKLEFEPASTHFPVPNYFERGNIKNSTDVVQVQKKIKELGQSENYAVDWKTGKIVRKVPQTAAAIK